MPNLYEAIILEIFRGHYRKGVKSFVFDRSEIEKVAKRLRVKLPKNIGDLFYSFRFRKAFPQEIRETASAGNAWMLELAGQAKYRFRLGKESRIIPRVDSVRIKIPDSTPEIVAKYALSDEQALLAKVRYNRLIDIFLGITTYSMQNHLRTTVHGMGQIEVDEIYVGINQQGVQFVVPVQAKGGKDQLGTVQTNQDIEFCRQKFPELVCRAVSAQFLNQSAIALFELVMSDGEVKVIAERHYELVPADQITAGDLKTYGRLV